MTKSKEATYTLLVKQIRELTIGETDGVTVMANTCAAIHETMGFWWTGWYRVMNGELALGPFHGPIACGHIAFGKGVCGTAWKEKKTIIVPDVAQFPGHIACSSLSRSEVVVPVLNPSGDLIAVLDIDSTQLSAFDETDRRYLEEICSLVAPFIGQSYTYKYPRPAVTADCVVITREAQPRVLLIQRGRKPFMGSWAFPGGFMEMNETAEQCAMRELEEETGLKVKAVYQVGAYTQVDRDPRGRTITVAFLATTDCPTDVTGQDDAAKAQWFLLSELPPLAFDHAEIMDDALKLYKNLTQKQAPDSAVM